eukprot:gb/GECG01014610.1/.p1 GENE.gb/GECG01014610.1/~~gb/GECG01014610.1/.p1  ORF type:complete len:164 (+),score=12.97 gb/GECG01014610.1/:1-492(+)
MSRSSLRKFQLFLPCFTAAVECTWISSFYTVEVDLTQFKTWLRVDRIRFNMGMHNQYYAVLANYPLGGLQVHLGDYPFLCPTNSSRKQASGVTLKACGCVKQRALAKIESNNQFGLGKPLTKTAERKKALSKGEYRKPFISTKENTDVREQFAPEKPSYVVCS